MSLSEGSFIRSKILPNHFLLLDKHWRSPTNDPKTLHQLFLSQSEWNNWSVMMRNSGSRTNIRLKEKRTSVSCESFMQPFNYHRSALPPSTMILIVHVGTLNSAFMQFCAGAWTRNFPCLSRSAMKRKLRMDDWNQAPRLSVERILTEHRSSPRLSSLSDDGKVEDINCRSLSLTSFISLLKSCDFLFLNERLTFFFVVVVLSFLHLFSNAVPF